MITLRRNEPQVEAQTKRVTLHSPHQLGPCEPTLGQTSHRLPNPPWPRDLGVGLYVKGRLEGVSCALQAAPPHHAHRGLALVRGPSVGVASLARALALNALSAFCRAVAPSVFGYARQAQTWPGCCRLEELQLAPRRSRRLSIRIR
jgi:hypothetical protein